MSNVYAAAEDKWFAVSSSGDRNWPDFCRALERPDLETDPRFNERTARANNCETLIALLDETFASKSRDQWLQAFKERQLIASAVQDYHELLTDPQVLANEYLQEVEISSGRRALAISPPVTFSSTKPAFRWPVPALGRHTDAILSEHGFSNEEVQEFRTNGVV